MDGRGAEISFSVGPDLKLFQCSGCRDVYCKLPGVRVVHFEGEELTSRAPIDCSVDCQNKDRKAAHKSRVLLVSNPRPSR